MTLTCLLLAFVWIGLGLAYPTHLLYAYILAYTSFLSAALSNKLDSK